MSRGVTSLALAAVALLGASNALQNAVANGDTRTLTFQHTHREEADFTVTFKRDGKYDKAALAKLNHYLRDWRNDKVIEMDPHLFDIVWEVYRDVGGKEPIQVISSYRSPETNSMLRRRSSGVAQFSQHMLGKALDFRIPGVKLEELRYAGLRLQRGGVGFYPSSEFVHLDTGSVRHWPRMAPDLLARVMSGRTAVQLAAAERRRMPAKTADDADEEDAKPTVVAAAATTRAATRKVERKPETKPGAIANTENAQQAFALASASSKPVTLGAAPRRAPSAGPDRNAAVQSWLSDIDASPRATSNNDRVAPETALAYAAAAAAEREPQRTASLAAPMPTQRPQAVAAIGPSSTVGKSQDRVPAGQEKATQEKAAGRPKAGQRFNDPWLRSVTLATNITYSAVTIYGPFDARGVQAMMEKPDITFAMTFRDDPYDGMSTERFTGEAVSFLPTVSFGPQRQASLQ